MIDYRLSTIDAVGAIWNVFERFCRYDVYDQRRNLQVCADFCKFFVAQLTILQYFPLSVFSFGIDIALT